MRSSRRSAAAFPGHAILGEESGHIAGARDGAGYKWIVDPIDGTVNFVHGFPYYAVSIALVHGTETTHAVVYDPVHDECFTAVKGKGAQRNGAPMRVSACTDLDERAGGNDVAGARATRDSRRTFRRSTTWQENAPACAAPARARSISRTWPPGASTDSG